MKSTVELSASKAALLVPMRYQQLSRMKKNIYQMAEVELMSQLYHRGEGNRKPFNYQFQRYIFMCGRDENPIHDKGYSYRRKNKQVYRAQQLSSVKSKEGIQDF